VVVVDGSPTIARQLQGFKFMFRFSNYLRDLFLYRLRELARTGSTLDENASTLNQQFLKVKFPSCAKHENATSRHMAKAAATHPFVVQLTVTLYDASNINQKVVLEL
jgi:hypothetical protein